jgi:pyrimidine-specific ribonucleoside hydrolase
VESESDEFVNSTVRKTRVIIDTDPGIDDALAILYLLGSELVNVVGITTVAGNADIETVTRNALSILELAQRPDIPVARGANGPLAGERPHSGSSHGSDALGNAPRPTPRRSPNSLAAVDFMAQQLASADEDVTILAIAPLTNVALLCREYPALLPKVREIVVMGASFGAGNVTPFAEFNTWSDPEAASEVFAANVPITVVPLNVSSQLALPLEALKALPPGAMRDFVVAANEAYDDVHEENPGVRETIQHDAGAAVCLAHPEIFEFVEGTVRIDYSSGPQRGQSIMQALSPEGARVRAAVRHDQAKWRTELLRGLTAVANRLDTPRHA